MLGAGTALSLTPAEPAPVTGTESAKSEVRGLRFGLCFVFAPCFQLFHGEPFFLHFLGNPGLDNGGANPLDGVAVDGIEPFQHTQRIKAHLAVVDGGNLHALAVLVVGDPQHVAADHGIVAGAETVRDVVGQINANLERYLRDAVKLVGFFGQEVNVSLSGLNHFILPQRIGLELFQFGIELAGGHYGEFLLAVKLAYTMREGSFVCVDRRFSRELFFVTGGGGAV